MREGEIRGEVDRELRITDKEQRERQGSIADKAETAYSN